MLIVILNKIVSNKNEFIYLLSYPFIVKLFQPLAKFENRFCEIYTVMYKILIPKYIMYKILSSPSLKDNVRM